MIDFVIPFNWTINNKPCSQVYDAWQASQSVRQALAPLQKKTAIMHKGAWLDTKQGRMHEHKTNYLMYRVYLTLLTREYFESSFWRSGGGVIFLVECDTRMDAWTIVTCSRWGQLCKKESSRLRPCSSWSTRWRRSTCQRSANLNMSK